MSKCAIHFASAPQSKTMLSHKEAKDLPLHLIACFTIAYHGKPLKILVKMFESYFEVPQTI